VPEVQSCYKQDSTVCEDIVGELVSESDNSWGSVIVSCCCEKLVAEAGDCLETQRKGNVRCWKPLPDNDW
jgi:hypothetical protein